MRRVAEPDRIQRFMTALAVKATRPARLYFTGGATAVLPHTYSMPPRTATYIDSVLKKSQTRRPCLDLDHCGGGIWL